MKRAVLVLVLVPGLISLAACDFDAQYRLAWCARHPTDPWCREGGAAQPDAGTPDAGTPDAGTPDAGSPDAGGADAGGCAQRALRLTASPPGAARACVTVTLTVVCSDDASVSALTETTTVALSARVGAEAVARGRFFDDLNCADPVSTVVLDAGTSERQVSFDTTSSTQSHAFGRFLLQASVARGDVLGDALSLDFPARLVFTGHELGEELKLPVGVCVPLPRPRVGAGSPLVAVLAPVDSPLVYTLPAGMVACAAPQTKIPQDQSTADESLSARLTTLGAQAVGVAGTEVLTNGALAVRGCQTAGAYAPSRADCCVNSAADAGNSMVYCL